MGEIAHIFVLLFLDYALILTKMGWAIFTNSSGHPASVPHFSQLTQLQISDVPSTYYVCILKRIKWAEREDVHARRIVGTYVSTML
jgi:hypothetical protein